MLKPFSLQGTRLPISALALGTALALSLWLAIGRSPSPDAADTGAPAEFSIERARTHLDVIAAAPHPSGSVANRRLSEYLVREFSQAGLETEIQEDTAVEHSPEGQYTIRFVRNIVARMLGSDGTKAVLLSAHYDSAVASPGAGDDGAAVAALVEAARALRTGTPLKNDVIFLLTDGEEIGLLGAKAFVRDHRLARKISVAFNFEARGVAGPSLLFETGNHNASLIREFAAAVEYPYGSSFLATLYKAMPNDTDFSVLRSSGITGLNFAFAEGWPKYHSAMDVSDAVAARSLAHHGHYALSLARHFGALSLPLETEGDAVFFNVAGSWMTTYPFRFALPAAILLAVLFAAVTGHGIVRRRLRALHVLSGLGAILAEMIIIAALGWGVAMAAVWLAGPQSRYLTGWYAAAVVALAVGVFSLAQPFLRRRIGAESVVAGSLIVWVAAAVVSAAWSPGISYLFLWPAGAGVCLLAVQLKLRDTAPESLLRIVAAASLTVPVVLVLAPALRLAVLALPGQGPLVAGAMLALWLGLFVPRFEFGNPRLRWLMPALSLSAITVCFAAIGLSTGYAPARPMENQVFYIQNVADSAAYWAARGARPDPWTSQFVGDRREMPAPESMPVWYRRLVRANSLLFNSARFVPIPGVAATVVSDRTAGDGRRKLKLLLKSAAGGEHVFVRMHSTSPLVNVTTSRVHAEDHEIVLRNQDAELQAVDGNQSESDQAQISIRYVLPEEGMTLSVELSSSEQVLMEVIQHSFGLPDSPELGIRARPAHMIPVRNQGDATILMKSFLF